MIPHQFVTVGLSPMDGITDAAFRQIVDEIGQPDILFTEFIPIEGVLRNRIALFHSLARHTSRTRIIVQFFGHNPDHFYQAYFIARQLGFDGIDVNMGCPDNLIVKKGGGAALMDKLDVVSHILNKLLLAKNEYINGKRIKLSNELIPYQTREKKQFTISVKTRIFSDRMKTDALIQTILNKQIDFFTIHARTREQRYTGKADWEEIAHIVQLTQKTGIHVWGNGDIQNRDDAYLKARETGVSGILIGRAALGNPWVFTNKTPQKRDIIQTMLRHARLFLIYRPDLDLKPLRKHLAWYWRGMYESAQVRNNLMAVSTISDLQKCMSVV